MKIRWTRQSLRLRISPSEMARLLDGGEITETLFLPGGACGAGWSATLAPAHETGFQVDKGCLRLTLSNCDLIRLAVPEAEGVYFETLENPPVRYYVEKDFPCVHPGAPEAKEPAFETFAPPPGFKERHNAACAAGQNV